MAKDLKIYQIEWCDNACDNHTTLVLARSRVHAEDLFIASDYWTTVREYCTINVPRRAGIVDV